MIRYFHFPWSVYLFHANLIVWQYIAFDALAGHFATSIFIAWTFKVFDHENSLFKVPNKYFKSKISNACKFQRKPMKMPLLLWIPRLTMDIVSQFPNIWTKWIQHILLYCYTCEVVFFSYHFPSPTYCTILDRRVAMCIFKVHLNGSSCLKLYLWKV